MAQEVGRRGFLKLGALGALLAAATMAKPILEMFDGEEPAVQEPKTQLEFVRFTDYNPKGSVSIDDTFSADVAKGLERWLGEPRTYPTISDYETFSKAVLEDAQDLGYDAAKITQLSPREAAYFSTMLTANRLNYKGTADGETIKESIRETQAAHEKSKRKIEEMRLELDKTTDETRKKQLDAAIRAYKRLEQDQADTRGLIEGFRETFEAPNPIVGIVTAEYDTVPPDKIYIEQPEIVCRHYARVAAAVFSVLKDQSPLLANTYMVPHNTPALGHVWDQVTTVNKYGDRTKIAVAFVDPTWYDGLKEKGLDAFDTQHMGEAFKYLKEQVEALKEKHKATVNVKGL